MNRHLEWICAAALLTACTSSGPNWTPGDALEEADVQDDGDELDASTEVDSPPDVEEEEGEPYTGPTGFIGSPCLTADDCDYESAVCVEVFPEGMCSLECDLYCPDADGHPMTFCVDDGSLPDEATGFAEGACFSRCDYGWFPSTGCREGYGCTVAPRANEPGTEQHVCTPGEGDPVTGCLEELASMGVSFEPSSHTPESPDTHPSLTCTVEDPVVLHSPVHGVQIVSYYSGSESHPYMACRAAVALVRTIDDVAAEGVVAIQHMGTYNCRVISGTDTLSRHAYGDAIDLAGFEFEDGTVVTLVDDWEHDTTSPATFGGQFLYLAAHRWYDAWIWNTILTPNYNSAHDDHFHVDLTPDRHFLEYIPCPECSGRYIGPAPYDD